MSPEQKQKLIDVAKEHGWDARFLKTGAIALIPDDKNGLLNKTLVFLDAQSAIDFLNERQK